MRAYVIAMNPYFQAEQLKYRNSSMQKVTVLMPFCSVFFAAMLTHNFFTVDSYNWWYMILFPGMAAIVCGMISAKDGREKNRTIFTMPCDPGQIWDAKVFYGACISGIATIVMTFFTVFGGWLMETALHIKFTLNPSVPMQVAASLVMWVSFLWQIPFCLFLSQKIGTFWTLLIHVASYFVISEDVSLTPYYMLVPQALSARMMCPLLGVLPNGLPAVPGELTYSPQMTDPQSLLIGIPASVLWFVLLWFLTRKWFTVRAERGK